MRICFGVRSGQTLQMVLPSPPSGSDIGEVGLRGLEERLRSSCPEEWPEPEPGAQASPRTQGGQAEQEHGCKISLALGKSPQFHLSYNVPCFTKITFRDISDGKILNEVIKADLCSSSFSDKSASLVATLADALSTSLRVTFLLVCSLLQAGLLLGRGAASSGHGAQVVNKQKRGKKRRRQREGVGIHVGHSPFLMIHGVLLPSWSTANKSLGKQHIIDNFQFS